MELKYCTNLPVPKYLLMLIFGLMLSHQAFSEDFNLADFQSHLLSQHNTYRAKHHSPNLSIDSGLNASAQAWAEKMLSMGKLEHSDAQGVGENLYFIRTTWLLPGDSPMSAEQIASYQQYYPGFTPPEPYTGANLAVKVAKAWYVESQDYDYATTNSINGKPVGHFTQMVWKNTTAMGCGAASKQQADNSLVTYVVCQYAPPGNTYSAKPGQSQAEARAANYGANVLKP